MEFATNALGLLSKVNAQKKIQRQLRLVVLGLDNSGKTTILKSLTNETLDNVAPTQGFNIKSLNHGNFKFNVWDLGGKVTPHDSSGRSTCHQASLEKLLRPD